MTKRITVETAEELLGLYFPVLDQGFVSLVDYSGGDESIEQAARVSYGAGTRKTSETRGLIRYLMRMAHSSPFEMVQLKFHICMPIYVDRQHSRHRMSSKNELSGRYSILPTVFHTPAEEQVRTQSTTNKQGRSEEVLSENGYLLAQQGWKETRELVADHYNWLLEEGVAKETARIDLPLSTYTQFYWSIDLHNLLHYLTLRTDSHAQWEIQQYAKIMAGMVQRVTPLTFEAWVDYKACAATFSRVEMKALQFNWSTGKGTGHVVAGLKGRELQEFIDKCQSKAVPDFNLDLSTAKTAEYFAERFASAVPKPKW